MFGLRGVGPAKRVSAVCVHRDVTALGYDDNSLVLLKGDVTRSLKTTHRPTALALYGSREILFVAHASLSGLDVAEVSADSLALVTKVTITDTPFHDEPECLSESRNVLAAGVGRQVFVYDRTTTTALKGHRGTVTSLSFFTHLIISTSQDRTLRAWDGDACVYQTYLGSAPLTCLATSASSRIVTGSADGILRVYEWLPQKRSCVEMITVDTEGLLPLSITFATSSILLVATASHLCVVNVIAGAITHAYAYSPEVGVAGRASFSKGDSGDEISLALSAAFEARAFLGFLSVKDLLHEVPESGDEDSPSFFSRHGVPNNSPLLAKDPKRRPKPKRDLLAWDSYDKQKSQGTTMPVLFHSRIKSSGYGEKTVATKRRPRASGVKKRLLSSSISKPKQQYPIDCGVLDVPQPQHDLNVAKSLTGAMTSSLAIPAIACAEDARSLAIATTNGPTLIHRLPISSHTDCVGGGGPIVIGRDASVSQQKRRLSVAFSHDCRRLITTGADSTVEIWATRGLTSNCVDEPELFLSPRRPKSNLTRAGARFFYLDKFVLWADGSSLEMHAFDSSLKASNSARGIVQHSPRRRHDAASKRAHSFKHDQVQYLTAIGCINSELSPLIITAGSNRAVHILDAGAGRTARIVEEAHARPVHSISVPVPTSATHGIPQVSLSFCLRLSLRNSASLRSVRDGVNRWDDYDVGRADARRHRSLFRSH